jgi:5-methylcytosine-specific restriction endonuclease McrA
VSGHFDYPDHYTMKRNRLAALAETDGKCKQCGHLARHVHHIDGSRTNHAVENLMPLCCSCHFKAHAEAHKGLKKHFTNTKRFKFFAAIRNGQ